MLKFLNVTFLVLAGFFNAQAYAQIIKLNPQESKEFTNTTFWTIKANCNVQSQKQSTILVRVLKNKGQVNGRTLSTGQSTKVNSDEDISVSADPGTRVILVNLGKDSVQATCQV